MSWSLNSLKGAIKRLCRVRGNSGNPRVYELRSTLVEGDHIMFI